ncbi:MAG: hypothetical protein V2A55_03695 [Candidatus Jorgensenbacteria bacterium]
MRVQVPPSAQSKIPHLVMRDFASIYSAIELRHSKSTSGLTTFPERRCTLKQVEKGLFLIEEQMPCPPGAIDTRRQALLSTLGKAECEEAAALLITCSQEAGPWVGATWQALGERAKKNGYPVGKLFVGVRGLVKMGLTRRVRPGGNVMHHLVFFPVPELALRLMKAQGIAN